MLREKIIIGIVMLSFLFAGGVLAAEPAPIIVRPQVPLPGMSEIAVCTGGECNGIAIYLVAVYRFILGLVAVAAFITFLFAGFLWMTAGTGNGITRAKELMRGGMIGLLLAFGSYTILWTVNPNLVHFGSLAIGTIEDLKISYDPVSTENTASDLTPEDVSAQARTGGTGNVPLFKQTDYNVPYGQCGTIKTSGCGPTSAAMVAKFYGKDTDPKKMADSFATNGFRACASGCNCQGTSYGAFSSSKTIGALGLKGQQLGSTGQIIEKLREGKPIIVTVGPSIFTKGGHFIVLTGLDAEGKIMVNDPNKSCYKGLGCTNHIPKDLILPHVKTGFYIHP